MLRRIDRVPNVWQRGKLMKKEVQEVHTCTMNNEMSASISLKHYKNFMENKHLYGKGKLHTGPCDRIAARIRLGYRNVWEVNISRSVRVNPVYASCVLCEAPYANTLPHYINSCPKLKPFRPKGMGYHELLLHFCKPKTLYPILSLYPGMKL